MKSRLSCAPLMLALALSAAPALASENAEAEGAAADEQAQPEPAPEPAPPPPFAFPLPLIAGRVGGVGIAPNGPGFVLDLNSARPSLAPRKGPRIAFGPAFRFSNDRNNRISDDVVVRAGKLDAALEVGANVAVSIPNVVKPFDSLSIGVQARRDVLGAHGGWVIEPQIGYRALVGKGFTLQAQASTEIVTDRFADYYFTVTPRPECRHRPCAVSRRWRGEPHRHHRDPRL